MRFSGWRVFFLAVEKLALDVFMVFRESMHSGEVGAVWLESAWLLNEPLIVLLILSILKNPSLDRRDLSAIMVPNILYLTMPWNILSICFFYWTCLVY